MRDHLFPIFYSGSRVIPCSPQTELNVSAPGVSPFVELRVSSDRLRSAHVSYDERCNCENLSRRLSLPEREHQFSGIFVHRIFLLFTATWLAAVVAQQTRPCWTEFRVTSPEKLLLSRVVSLIETRIYPSRSQGTTFVRFWVTWQRVIKMRRLTFW